MTRRLWVCVMVALLPMAPISSKATGDTWLATRWNGESAYAATSAKWTAIVSLDRGRLVHFGPRDSDVNILASNADPKGEEGFGGHRVWCGPQQEWSASWPPPKSWEHSGAGSWSQSGTSLELTMPPSPDGWPDLVRVYTVDGDRLACGIRLVGGTRPAQVMQILQTPPATVVTLKWLPDSRTQEHVRVLRKTEELGSLTLPRHIRRDGDSVIVTHQNSPVKLAFATQTIVARHSGVTLLVSKGDERGRIAFEPDDGLYTQVYLGAPKQGNVVELEQLSPAYHPDTGGYAEMILELR